MRECEGGRGGGRRGEGGGRRKEGGGKTAVLRRHKGREDGHATSRARISGSAAQR